MVRCLLGRGIYSRTSIRPSAVVQGFFLAPDQSSIGVFVEVRSDKVIWERGDLLQPTDSNVVDAFFFTFLQEGMVYLAGAKNVSTDILRSNEALRVGVRDVSLEVCVTYHLRQV